MKVLCISIPSAIDGVRLDSSPWVTVGREYIVLGVASDLAQRLELHILTDDRNSLGWFDARCFVTTEEAVPETWAVRVAADGSFDLGPSEWMAPGLWERYYDGDEAVRVAVRREIERRLGARDG